MPTPTIKHPERGRTAGADRIAQARCRLRSHRLYEAIRTPEALRIFTEHHVVCALDFMSLLKSLQRELTCVAVPWTPSVDPESARLILSIVLDEETDVRADGRVQSHFAWYLEAMDELGADTAPARDLVQALVDGARLQDALRVSRVPTAAQVFGDATTAFLERPVHVRAAVFFHGREEVIPEIFLPIVERLDREGLPCASLREYLLRHVEVDGSSHGPLAEGMLARLYQGDAALRVEAEEAALESLTARERLWDAIADAADSRDAAHRRTVGGTQGF